MRPAEQWRPIQLALMKIAAAFVVFAMGALSSGAAEKDVAFYVNTLIGTQQALIGYGGTMPFVTTPFGMTNWTPQTRQNKISVTSYNYDDTTISGFIGTHQPAIWMGDYGYVTVIPQVGELRTTPESRKLPYSHGSEKARPDYYGVSLDAGSGWNDPGGDDSHRAMLVVSIHFSEGPQRPASSSKHRDLGSQGWRRSILKRGRLQATTRIGWMRI